jgi:dTMP kinase
MRPDAGQGEMGHTPLGGKLIVLEGLDETALQVLQDRLYRWLRGRGVAVEQTREPTYGPVGSQIRLQRRGRLRLDPASLALFWTADRLDHLGREDGVRSWLADGRHVLCAGYLLRSYADLLDQVDLEWLWQINAPCRVPDLTLFIDAPPSAQAPGTVALRARYLQAIAALQAKGPRPERGPRSNVEGQRIVIVSGSASEEEVYHACQQHIASLLNRETASRASVEGGKESSTLPGTNVVRMQANPGPGVFVVLEGLDGAGSTTQAQLLSQRLQALGQAYLTYEPSDGPAGLQIRMVLGHRVRTDPATLAALFAADRMDHLYHQEGEGGILAHLRQGIDVVSDRYYLSSLAYQGMDLDWDWLWHMHARCIRPDITFFVDVAVDVCLERIAAGRGAHFDLFENRSALTRVRQSYLEAIARLHQAGDRVEIVRGDALPDQVHDAIWKQVEELCQSG